MPLVIAHDTSHGVTNLSNEAVPVLVQMLWLAKRQGYCSGLSPWICI